MKWIEGISPITFPGLGIEIDPAAGFTLGPLTVNFYGVIIALGLILAVLYAWKRCSQFGLKADDITVVMNSESLKALEGAVLAGLKEKMLGGVTLKANDNFDGGFRISVNNGNAYYDYSAEAVVEMLSNYLSPRVTDLMKEAE